MNLKLPKRTLQIDNAREVLLGYDTSGGPIWTEKGGNKLTGDQKHEVSAKLAAQKHRAAVEKAADTLERGFSMFLEESLLERAPTSVVESYNGDQTAFAQWCLESGFGFHRDGLNMRLLYRGKEVASLRGKCDPLIKSEVLLELKRRSMAQGAAQ